MNAPDPSKMLCNGASWVTSEAALGSAPPCCDRWFAGRFLQPACLIEGNRPEKSMLETIAIILIVLWLLGLVSSYTLGGFIHALLVIAIVLILVRLITGRRPL